MPAVTCRRAPATPSTSSRSVLAGAELRGDVREWEWMDRGSRRIAIRRWPRWLLARARSRASRRLADGAYRFWFRPGPLRRGPRRLRACRRARRASVPARSRAPRSNLTPRSHRSSRARRARALSRGGARRAAPTRRARRDLWGAVLLGTIRASRDHEEGIGALRRASRSRAVAHRSCPNFALAPRSSGNVRGTVRASARARRRRAAGDAGRRRGRRAASPCSATSVSQRFGTGHWAEAAERLAAALALADERSDPVGLLESIESIAAAAAAPVSPRPRRVCSGRPRNSRPRGASSSRPSTSRSATTLSSRCASSSAKLRWRAQHSGGRSLTLAEAVELAAAVAAASAGTADRAVTRT